MCNPRRTISQLHMVFLKQQLLSVVALNGWKFVTSLADSSEVQHQDSPSKGCLNFGAQPSASAFSRQPREGEAISQRFIQASPLWF